MTLVKIILLYLIIINIYYYHKFRSKRLNFNHWGEFINSSVIVLSFFVFFFIFVRILSLFREKKVFDLTLIFQNFDVVFIVCCIGFLISLRRTLMFVVKLNFIKLHYFGLSTFLPMNPIAKQYNYFYVDIVTVGFKKVYKTMYWVNFLFGLIMLGLLCYDLLRNNLVLDLSLWFVPSYSLFRFCFVCIRYVSIKQNLVLDYFVFHNNYCGKGYVYPDDDSVYGRHWQVLYPAWSWYENNIVKI